MVSLPLPESPLPSPLEAGPPQADRPAVTAVATPMALVYLMKVRRSTPAALRADKESSMREMRVERERRRV
ncbi:hypothetical protein GCM10022384_28790 [Streptomyces marokkonensis]|uniref:Uncharacterized protein n=1 Tax=Streptomyces marokkonensis TaxID=324855 RepID=A0ABP7Q6D7_9ACTN